MHKIIALLVKANIQIYWNKLFRIYPKISCLFTSTRPQWKFFCRSILKDLIGRISLSIHLATFFPFYLPISKEEGRQ